jgi:hypothetical protein
MLTRKTRRAGGATGSGNAVCLAANSPQNIRIERSPQAQNFLRAIDFEAVNRAAIAYLPAVLARLVPGGKQVGGEYVALNPTRADRHAGSMVQRPGAKCWRAYGGVRRPCRHRS